ncbi:hypothetical protein Scep_004916 [Stephania cephalantha]|uniref:Uncharacterized protein n=1 Tax=Stephania cephalantha TaxID=152367 RepID=A0AAP0KV19_9MAGN
MPHINVLELGDYACNCHKKRRQFQRVNPEEQQQQQHSLSPKLTGVGNMDQNFPLCSIKCN